MSERKTLEQIASETGLNRRSLLRLVVVAQIFGGVTSSRMRASRIGSELWGDGRKSPSGYARSATNLLWKLCHAGLVVRETTWGLMWGLTDRGLTVAREVELSQSVNQDGGARDGKA